MNRMFDEPNLFKFGFTGSSEPITSHQKQILENVLRKYVDKRSAECHNGLCINADEECYKIIIRCFPHVRMVFHPPLNDSKTFKFKKRLQDERRKPLPYLKRNMGIVSESNYLFATPKQVIEELRSGTWATIRYARTADVPICLIFPNGSIRYEGKWPTKQKVAAMTLFSSELWHELGKYVPQGRHPQEQARILSGRMLEEIVELHLESGGTPQSAMSHVMDAITNESFKFKKEIDAKGGFSQNAYPSAFYPCYRRKEVVPELADAFFLLVTNMITSQVGPEELLNALMLKVDKLRTAKQEGRLHVTGSGCFYIRKD